MHTFSSMEQRILGNVLTDKRLLQRPCLFPTSPGPARDRSHYSHFQVYDVTTEGVAIPAELTSGLPTSKALEYWDLIRVKRTPRFGLAALSAKGTDRSIEYAVFKVGNQQVCGQSHVGMALARASSTGD
jgi:hypothetical protein